MTVAGGPDSPGVSLLARVSARTAMPSRIETCIQCGTCGGSCPSASDMDHTPRALFALLRAGLGDQALRSNTPWMCVSCYHCAVRCPQQIHIPDVMYAVKRMSIEEGYRTDPTGADFSATFLGNVERFGRSYEVGLTALHYLRHFPSRLPGMAPMALGLLRHGRMSFTPRRIVGMDQLQAILDRAKELETGP